MFRRYFFISAVVFAVPIFSQAAWAGPNMNPGKWEITTTTEMAGMPSQSSTYEQCITPDELVPTGQDASQECQIEDIQTHGNTVSWKISCSDEGGGMTGTGQVTYDGDSMNGTMNMTIAPYGMPVKNTLSGQRIGDCENASMQSSEPASEASGNAVTEAITEDTKDVGQAARDEAKESAEDKAREGVRNVFDGLFK